MTVERTGSCLCGKVSLKIHGRALMANICYCRHCQKALGSFAFSGAIFLTQNVEYSDPESVIKMHVDGDTKSGTALTRYFCSNCGAHVKVASGLITQTLVLPTGLVDGDDKEDLRPTKEYFCVHKADWFPGVDGAEKYPLMPPM